MFFQKKLLLSTTIFFQVFYCAAQTSLTVPRNIKEAYDSGSRSTTGSPGKKYWQNNADYSIQINFDPNTRKIKGKVAIDYTNNSPSTLQQVLFKLYPNLFKHGVIRNMPVAAEDESDGLIINALSIDKIAQSVDKLNIDGTNMIINIPAVSSKQQVHFDIDFSYTLNKGSHIRTGQVDTGAFFIAYFFPRIAVYDDIDGWNENQYKGTEEFYNDFGNFNAEITVPGNYQVWATGNLLNATQLYDADIVKRINDAEKSDAITNIIKPEDLASGRVTVKNDSNTWKFAASSVTDFAFATSNHYLWQASSLVVDPKTGRRTRVDAVFNPNHEDYFDVISYARKTVADISYKFPKWPYPYLHETVFDGLDQMEYPMMVNDNPTEKPEDGIELTTHEIFHTIFPFYMGINETKYGWMDEGWATIGEWTISQSIDPTITDLYGVGAYENSAGDEDDQPIMTLTTQLSGATTFTNSYPKPALGYLYLKDMLGDELFTKALHYYISEWHGKHPMPFDFFNCMNKGSGQDLTWFWKRWFFEQGVPDQAITRVSSQNGLHTITISNIGNKPVPVDLNITFTDGSTRELHKSIACWKNGKKANSLKFRSNKKIKRIKLGNGYDPDVNKENNFWEAK